MSLEGSINCLCNKSDIKAILKSGKYNDKIDNTHYNKI